MPTLGQLIDEVSAQLHGWGSTQDRVTVLTNSIDNSQTTFVVDAAFGQAVGISPGVIEIDSELIYITNVDQATNTITVANGIGRGYNGTTAVSHNAGAKVISRPRFPRVWLMKLVNEVLGGVYPDLFGTATDNFTITFPNNTYTLTKQAEWIIDVQWQHPLGMWLKIRGYKLDPYDGTLRLGSGGMIGRPLRVLYAVQPTQFTTETQDFVTTTGLPLSTYDVLTLGAVAYAVPGIDISRAQLTSVEQSDRSRTVPPNAGLNASKHLMNEFKDRLANEAKALRKRFKPRIRRDW